MNYTTCGLCEAPAVGSAQFGTGNGPFLTAPRCETHLDPSLHCFREESETEQCEACGRPASEHVGCDCR